MKEQNVTRATVTVHYDWSLLNDRDIRYKYALAQRNKFKALQEETEHKLRMTNMKISSTPL